MKVHDQSITYQGIDVHRNFVAISILLALESHSPQHGRDIYKQRVVRQVFAYA
jgi:hypothetical protein